MSTLTKLRREAAAFLATFTGGAGELLIDTTNWRAVVQDGATPGGYPLAKVSELPGSGALSTLAKSPNGANMQFGVLEELVSLSGASVSSTIQIPARAILFGVSCRTIAAVTGAPSYGLGVAGNATQFGGGLGAAAGSNNSGVIGPTAFYSPSNIVITATSGSFTGGSVRIAIQYMLCSVPAS